MGRPTLTDQLQKAVAEGDMDKIKEIIAKLVKPKPPIKKKPKPTISKKTKVVIDPQTIDECEPGDQIEYASDHIFKPSSRGDGAKKSQEYVDSDGNKKMLCSKLPFKVIRNRKNIWEDNTSEYVQDAEFQKKIDKKLKKVKAKKEKRSPVKKISVECAECHKKLSVWPADVMTERYVCDDCLNPSRRNRR